MSVKNKAFRGLIYSVFNNEAEFARTLNWSRQRLNKISNGTKQPDLQEVDEMAKHLQIQPEHLIQIFLTNKSPNEQPITS